jgi:hypothetical protein
MTDTIELKPILPKIFKKNLFIYYFADAMKIQRDLVRLDFLKTTATWKRKPEFSNILTVSNTMIRFLVETSDEIYGYVDKGTRPHVIEGNPVLSFMWGGKGSYKAKTRVRVLGSSGGGSSGDRVAFASVQHPGFEGRQFEDEILKKHEPLLWTRINRAFKNAIQASGHKIT